MLLPPIVTAGHLRVPTARDPHGERLAYSLAVADVTGEWVFWLAVDDLEARIPGAVQRVSVLLARVGQAVDLHRRRVAQAKLADGRHEEGNFT